MKLRNLSALAPIISETDTVGGVLVHSTQAIVNGGNLSCRAGKIGDGL